MRRRLASGIATRNGRAAAVCGWARSNGVTASVVMTWRRVRTCMVRPFYRVKQPKSLLRRLLRGALLGFAPLRPQLPHALGLRLALDGGKHTAAFLRRGWRGRRGRALGRAPPALADSAAEGFN